MSEIETTIQKIPYLSAEQVTAFTGPECIVSSIRLYHGSGYPDITQLELGKDEASMPLTLGDGLYFTPDEASAADYARRRAGQGRGTQPTVYEVVTADNLKVANLDNEVEGEQLADSFMQFLHDKKPTSIVETIVVVASIDNFKAKRQRLGGRALKVGLRGGTSHLFSEFMQQAGYDGVIGMEGGEGDDVGQHTSVVIFNPQNVKLVDKNAA